MHPAQTFTSEAVTMRETISIERLEDTTIRLGGVGDNWHMSWAANDKQYVALCDGSGWPEIEGHNGKSYNARVYAINGGPPEPSFEHLPGYPDLYCGEPPDSNRYYGFGILALDSSIYHFMSTPNHVFSEPGARFAGAKLIYSADNGETWRNQDGSPLEWERWDERTHENMAFIEEPGEAFSLLTVLQMGRNYEHNTDGFVYVYAPNGNTEGSMNQVVMFRARRESILDRASYEFFAGHGSGGTATWSSDIGEREVVHTFPAGWVNTKIHPYSWHPSVVYNAPLGLYLMANWGMGCAPDGMWFGKPSYLGFWAAEHPWGPWTQIHEDTAWTPAGDPGARAYQPQISPKWIANDGKSFWLVWTDFQVIDGKRPYYSFNMQEVRVHMG